MRQPLLFVPRNTLTNNSRKAILRGPILKLLKLSLHVSVKKFSHFELQFLNGFYVLFSTQNKIQTLGAFHSTKTSENVETAASGEGISRESLRTDEFPESELFNQKF